MEKEPLTYKSVNRDIIDTLSPPGKRYWIVIAVLAAIMSWAFGCFLYQCLVGLGVCGLNWPICWAPYITCFVFWVGIAHSGTLISAVLYLFRARWRSAIARSAEAMTVIAILTAGAFPMIHLGRLWKIYYLIPYPNQRTLWPSFKSPLMWDVLAVTTYLIVSTMFFSVGLIPDLASVRERTTGWRRKVYTILSLGWQGQSGRWQRYKYAYLLFAGIATPLVVSVHSVVSWDFAMSILPGWHSTIFAPYFVAGAIHSGLAMVLVLLIPMRKLFRIQHLITLHHLEITAKLMILTGLVVGYAYVIEHFIASYSNNIWEAALYANRINGTYAWAFWSMVICNAIAPLFFFFKRVRTSIAGLFVIAILVSYGMWIERFVIIVTSLAHDYVPYSWGNYTPRLVDLSIIAGSFAWFFMAFALFAKHLPAVSMTEVKDVLPPPEEEPSP
jgi:molybdopterin-containing oxidoreductase family membrane subunit